MIGVCLAAIASAPWTGEAYAQSGEEMQHCVALADDKVKLACFESLSSRSQVGMAAPAPTAATPVVTQSNWLIETSKSPADDSPQVYATSPAEDGGQRDDPIAITLRCREHKTDLIVFTNGFWGVGKDRLNVLYRIDSTDAKTMGWHSSTDGQAVFFPKDVAGFVRSLPLSGKLFLRVTDFRGSTHDATFQLAGLEAAKAQVGAACKWQSH